jgi:hypothetical protein
VLAVMASASLLRVVWEDRKYRCELWVTGIDSYELRLVRDDLVVRVRDTRIEFYMALAASWHHEIVYLDE